MDDKKICNDCNCAYYGIACPLCGKDDSGKIVKSSYEQNKNNRSVKKLIGIAFISILLFGIFLGITFKENIAGYFIKNSISVNYNSISFPDNGTMYYYTQNKLVGYIEITNKLGNNLLVKIKDELGNKTLVDVYIHPNSTVKVDIPLGKYKVYYAGGETWYGRDKYFGINTDYFISNDITEVSELINQSITIYMPDTPSPFSDMQKTYKNEFKD